MVLILYIKEDIIYTVRNLNRRATPYITEFKFQTLPAASLSFFITWNELGWIDYLLIIPSCTLQYGNGIRSGVEGRGLGKKGKGYLRSWGAFGGRQAQARPWRRCSGKPKARHESREYLEEQKSEKGKEGKQQHPDFTYLCFLRYALVTPIILPTSSHSSNIYQTSNMQQIVSMLSMPDIT